MDQRRYDEAITFQKGIIAANSADILSRVLLGNAHRENNQPKPAISEYEESLRLYQEGGSMNTYMLSYSLLGRALCKVAIYESSMDEELECFLQEADNVVNLFMSEHFEYAQAPDDMYEKAIELSIKLGFYLGGLSMAEEKLKAALAFLKADTSRDLAYRERLAAYAYSLMAKHSIKDVDGNFILVDSSIQAIRKLRRYCSIAASYIDLVHGWNTPLGNDSVIVINFVMPWRVAHGTNEPVNIEAGGLNAEILEKGMFDL
jgi:tetratricopeptide (TPR) repeat protein